MQKVDFCYEGETISVFCSEKDKMKDIVDKFCNKSSIIKSSICCLYSGNQLDENLTLENILQSNNIEKITILVVKSDNQEQNNSKVKASQIICPKCGEIALINFKDYKITTICKKNHKIEKILLKDFEETQMIDESKIICEECVEKNKSNSYHKHFFA